MNNDGGGRTYKGNKMKKVETEMKRVMIVKKTKRKCRGRKHKL